MPINSAQPTVSTPISEDAPNTFSRAWYTFFSTMSQKMAILAGVFSTSATAGTASALPAQPAGYMSIIDNKGVTRKVPYYNE